MRQLAKSILICAVCVVAFAAMAWGASAAPATQAGETINIGDTVTGTLSADSPSQSYTLNAQTGQVVSVTLTSDTFDAYLTLKDDAGNVLAENDDLSGTNSGFQGLSLPTASGYMLLVESYSQHNNSGAEAGDYTLAVTEQQVNHIEYSQSISGQLSTDEPSRDYVFSGQAGDVIVATQSSGDFDSYLHLLDGSGSELTSNDDSGGSLDSSIGPYTLPNTGSYTLRVTSISGDTAGAFTLTLSKTEVNSVSFNEPVEVTFAPNQTAQYFTFDGTAGDLVTISVDSSGTIDTGLTLSDQYNSQIATDADGGSGFDPEIYQQLLSSTGPYTVALQSVAPGTGTVTLTLKHTPPPSLDSGAQTLAFSDSQNARAVMFTAKAGETVTLSLRLNGAGTTGSPSVSVMQGSSTLASASGSSVSSLSFSITPSADGDVVVQITDYSYSNLSYEVSLEKAGE